MTTNNRRRFSPGTRVVVALRPVSDPEVNEGLAYEDGATGTVVGTLCTLQGPDGRMGGTLVAVVLDRWGDALPIESGDLNPIGQSGASFAWLNMMHASAMLTLARERREYFETVWNEAGRPYHWR